MRETNLRSLDLNLLVALKALLDEKHVTRAAKRVGLSQPAMSRALGRLRQILKDPLLVKHTSGLCLTTRAQNLYQPLQNIFIEINHVLSPPSFNPAEMQGEIVISTRDYETVTFLPPLINFLSKEAPGLKLHVIPLVGDDLISLDNHEVDIIIAGTESKSATLSRHTLFKENFVCLVSGDNPITQKKFTLDKFIAMKHCLVTISGLGPGLVDSILAEQGLAREVVIRVPHFLAASYIVADSDLIVTLPRRIGLLLSQNIKIKLLEPPIKIPDFSIFLYWHIRNQNNPMHKWMRNTIRTTASFI